MTDSPVANLRWQLPGLLRHLRLLHQGLRDPGHLRRLLAWEKQALSAMGFKRVGRHSEHAM